MFDPYARRVRALAFALTLVGATVSVPATAWGQEEWKEELGALKNELDELRRRDEEQRRRIEELEAQVRKMSATTASPAAAPSPAGVPAAPPATAATPAPTTTAGAPDERARRAAALDAALEQAGAAPATSETQTDLYSRPIIGGAQLRLIDLSFDILAAAGASTEDDDELDVLQGGGHDPRKNGFTLQQAELGLAGAVDPYLRAEAYVVYFIDPLSGESEVELEEAFATTMALPAGFEIEAGQSFTEFGRLNPRHPHEWDWTDQPVINSRLFGPDGMRAPGFRIGWLAPLPWFSELHYGMQNANGETMVSFLANEEVFEEAAIGGRPFTDRDVDGLGDLVHLVRWDNSWDLTPQTAVKVGASGLFGPNATGDDADTRVYGADFVAKWRAANALRGWPFLRVQAEIMRRDYEADGFVFLGDPDDPGDDVAVEGDKLDDWGLYTQALYGFRERWAAGLRFDYADGDGPDFDAATGALTGRDDDPFRDRRWRLSPLLAWSPSEFSRLRLQYNYDDAQHLDDGDAHSVWLALEVLYGAHPAHKF